MYGVTVYYAARVLVETPLFFISPLIYSVIIYFGVTN